MAERKVEISDEPGTIHAGPADGYDCTLCGLAFEGEGGGAAHVEVRGRINCPRCCTIIRHCKTYRPSDLAAE